MTNAQHSLEELENFYKSAQRPIERTRWQIIWLRKKGKKYREIADVVGYSLYSTQRIYARYEKDGISGVVDARQFNGSEPALNEAQQIQLSEALQKKRDDNGIWTSAKVQTYIRENFNIEVTEVCAWGYFSRLGFSPQAPRSTHSKAATERKKTDL